ncbi:MAG: heavy-metal-associated domain-containing protein [Bacteroidaceae bacterium]|nr:heavy-metal-associated domain-containing protein [Bacteroidaceae bacterium]
MKKIILSIALLSAMSISAKDIKTLVVTTQPQMHCENCEQKIKGNLRFEKGVKRIDTDLKTKNVTITYDAEKTTPEQLMKGLQKIGYKAVPVKAAPKAKAEQKQ